jgi:hypothetical protein
MDAYTIHRIRRSYDVEWRNAPELPGATLHRGREAVGADHAAQDEAWEWRIEAFLDRDAAMRAAGLTDIDRD